MQRAPATRSCRLAASAGRAREEDHAIRVPGNIIEGAHHLRAAPVSLLERNGRPQARIELAAKLGHQALLVLCLFDVALRDHDLTMPRFHEQKTHP